MGISNRNKKRLLIFSLIPILSALQLVTDDFTLRLIASIVLVIYVAFIIFLRDSVKSDESFEPELDSIPESETEIPETKSGYYETDEGEEFTIVSPHKDIEVVRTPTISPQQSLNRGTNFFKPPDLKPNFIKIAREELPSDFSHNEQFVFILEKILTVIKEAFLAHTALYFWYNKKTNRLTLERFVSVSKDITQRKFDVEDDILSKIVQKEEPELLTDITPSAEADVIRYYNSPQGIKSFVGVPLYYGKKLLGVLALDSKSNDTFGIETIYSLGRFVRVISIIIGLYEEKHSESQAEQRLGAILGILSKDTKFTTLEDLHEALEFAVTELIKWDAFAFVHYDPLTEKFKTTKIINRTSLKYVGENLEVELPGTLVGKSIISGMPVNIGNTSENDFKRYTKNDDISFDGSFLAVPLVYDDQNYGVLCFESLKNNFYSNNDIKFLKNATKIFAFILYSFTTQSMLRSLLSLDVETRALNYKSFIEQIRADMIKARESKLPSVIVLVKIDEFLEQDTLFESNPFPKVLHSIYDMIKEEMSPTNVLGRLDKRIFGIHFFNDSVKNVFLWAEKLRIKIARKPIAVVSKQTTFTVSIGVAASNKFTEPEDAIKDAELALKKAIEKGGNTVKSIN